VQRRRMFHRRLEVLEPVVGGTVDEVGEWPGLPGDRERELDGVRHPRRHALPRSPVGQDLHQSPGVHPVGERQAQLAAVEHEVELGHGSAGLVGDQPRCVPG